FQQAGCALDDDAATGAFVPRVDAAYRTTVPTVFACGGALGARSPEAAAKEGAEVGAAAGEAVRGKGVAIR
ncbi:MAG TPA: hypothetical protein VNZ52_12720, partial [Candidatus Thermoplasmatota archaeon]|nr:hypothetical protein [Candidatus Thermoplasmatota archaeon]